MSLLNEIIREQAAGGVTTAGAIGGFRDYVGEKNKKRMLKRNLAGFKIIKEDEDPKFDPNDVVTKLKNDLNAATDLETTAFGLEAEDGKMVKVWVDKNQAEDFESALSDAITPDEEDMDEETNMEIAEILYKLKDKFDIVDIEWGDIEEDEEESVDTPPTDGATPNENPENGLVDPEAGTEDNPEASDEADMTPEPNGDPEADAKSALQQVIDMMKADSSAKEAEAKAKEAEAKAKEAEAMARSAEAKVKSEEKTLDMEDYYASKKAEKEEADKISKMARYRHDMANDNDQKLSFENAKMLGDLIQKSLRK